MLLNDFCNPLVIDRKRLNLRLTSANRTLDFGPDSGFDGSSDVRLGHAEAVHLVNPANAFNCKR
jgi:hypothetical protein